MTWSPRAAVGNFFADLSLFYLMRKLFPPPTNSDNLGVNQTQRKFHNFPLRKKLTRVVMFDVNASVIDWSLLQVFSYAFRAKNQQEKKRTSKTKHKSCTSCLHEVSGRSTTWWTIWRRVHRRAWLKEIGNKKYKDTSRKDKLTQTQPIHMA